MTIQQQILEKFLNSLAASGIVDANKIAKLRDLMADGKKLRADDVVKLFSLPAGDDIK